jgi:hypothetical protein
VHRHPEAVPPVAGTFTGPKKHFTKVGRGRAHKPATRDLIALQRAGLRSKRPDVTTGQPVFTLIWADVMAYPDKPLNYFEECGWSIYDAIETALFRDHVDFPVRVLCITKPLSQLEG